MGCGNQTARSRGELGRNQGVIFVLQNNDNGSDMIVATIGWKVRKS